MQIYSTNYHLVLKEQAVLDHHSFNLITGDIMFNPMFNPKSKSKQEYFIDYCELHSLSEVIDGTHIPIQSFSGDGRFFVVVVNNMCKWCATKSWK